MHKGGYDEFDFDITEAVQRLPVADIRGGVPVTVEARLFYSKGVLCLDSARPVRFSLAGAGSLIDNLGTTHG
jgi:hypothetical protein